MPERQTISDPPAAFAMAMDIKGFSGLKPSIHDKIIDCLYPKIASIVHVGDRKKLIDKKSIGDGFMFYFSSVSDAVVAALEIRQLFREELFWANNKFESPLECRIGLHSGQFFFKKDAIEQREALFGHNVITVARLEPIVVENEIWCTESFKAAATHGLELPLKIKFVDLGERQFAKGWSREKVYSLCFEKDEPKIPAFREAEIIVHHNKDAKFRFTYFALIRLGDRTNGVSHVKSHLSGKWEVKIEAEYDIFGAYDVILRFKSEKKRYETEFADLLKQEKCIRRDKDCRLTEVNFEDKKGLTERIVRVPETRQHIKAFTYIKSLEIVKNEKLVRRVVGLARRACGKDFSVVTYYKNGDVLILPIVIRLDQYYALAEAIDQIESWVDKNEFDYNSIITYPVHDFREYFTNIAKR